MSAGYHDISRSSTYDLVRGGNAAGRPDAGRSAAAAGLQPALVATVPGMLIRLLDSNRRQANPFAWLWGFGKRMSDLLVSSVVLVLVLPLMLAAAAAVRLTSRGPILYSQERCGRNGRVFKVYKFRSMVRDADQRLAEMAQLAESADVKTTDAPAFKSADDPRVTTVGRFLRRTNIDELPQLINVLAGHMSLVGPRPLVPPEAETLPPEDASIRHSVRPGLTCLWQVFRTEETTFDDRIRLDLLYADRRSLLLDFALIALTPLAIVRGNASF